MKLHIAGGCGEHGRNCFFVDAEEQSFMVDCGFAKGEENPFPRLTKEEIQKCTILFLTHSHLDHTGAIEWMKGNGFTGDIVASEETLKQMKLYGDKILSLESITADNKGSYKEISFCYGKSGHCIGSVWYLFSIKNRRLLFTGDYHENSCYYQCDTIRNCQADLAVIDCAYGLEKKTYDEYLKELWKCLDEIPKGKSIVMPVPKYGRGQEIARELKKHYADIEIIGDEHYCKETEKQEIYHKWLHSTEEISSGKIDFGKNKIFFISDPQLQQKENQKLVEELLQKGAYAVMTGHAERHSFSEGLINQGKMKLLRFPVHMNQLDYKLFCEKNQFLQTIPYHSKDIACMEYYDFNPKYD